MLLAQSIVNGVFLGGLYACMALGFAMMWGVLNIINLAHGSMIVAGAYITWWLHFKLNVDPLLSVPINMLLMFAFGYAFQRYILNRVTVQQVFMTLILTFGLDMLLTNLMILLFTADIRSVTTWYSGNAFDVFGVRVSYTRLVVFLIAVLASLALQFLLQRTDLGRAIRAISQNPDAAKVIGVRTDHVYAVTFALGAALAGVAGALFAMLSAFSPVAGSAFTLKSFVVVILGGLGNVFGIIIGGLFLGIAENLASAFGYSGYRDAISFGLLLLILLVRPTGFLGKSSLSVTRA